MNNFLSRVDFAEKNSAFYFDSINQKFYVEGSKNQFTDISIMNISGTVVLQQSIGNDNTVLDLEKLNSGRYFIHLENALTSASFSKQILILK